MAENVSRWSGDEPWLQVVTMVDWRSLPTRYCVCTRDDLFLTLFLFQYCTMVPILNTVCPSLSHFLLHLPSLWLLLLVYTPCYMEPQYTGHSVRQSPLYYSQPVQVSSDNFHLYKASNSLLQPLIPSLLVTEVPLYTILYHYDNIVTCAMYM